MVFVIYTVAVSLGVVVIYIVIPWGAKLLIRKRFLTRAKGANTIFLTFDDGPEPESTGRIIELLRKARAKATFFVLGKNVERYPHLAKSIIENGHEIGEHSYQHLHAWKTGPLKSLRDLSKGEEALRRRSLLDHQRTLFRPPFGKMNLVTLLYVWLRKKQVAFWNIDPKDYDAACGQEVADRVIRQLEAGDVILLHDGRRNGNSNTQVTTAALGLILDACERKGLNTSLIGQLFGDSR